MKLKPFKKIALTLSRSYPDILPAIGGGGKRLRVYATSWVTGSISDEVIAYFSSRIPSSRTMTLW
jgi:hypothetical protein